jgi:mono/diheme cytochrome c family protein
MKPLLALTFSLALAASFAKADPVEVYAHHCASCHGKDGAGHTKPGKKLGVKDLTAADYQKTFSDDDAFKALKDGMKGEDGSKKMGSFAEKLSDDDIKAVVTYVRTLAK